MTGEFVGGVITYAGSALAGTGAAAGAGTAAGTAAGAVATDAAAGAVAAGTAGTAAGSAALTAATATDVAASSAAGLAATAAPTAASIGGAGGILGSGLSVSEAAAAATGASALYTLAQGRKGINIPPAPGQITNDQQVQATQQATLQREQTAGGLQSTTGTPGGQQGAPLGSSTMSNKSILGG